MSRTFRVLRPTRRSWLFRPDWNWRWRNKNGTMRDGYPTHVSSSCAHHGGCPWCENNRLFAHRRRSPLVDDDEGEREFAFFVGCRSMNFTVLHTHKETKKYQLETMNCVVYCCVDNHCNKFYDNYSC